MNNRVLFQIIDISDGWFEADICGIDICCSDLWMYDSPKRLLASLAALYGEKKPQYVCFFGEPGGDILRLSLEGKSLCIESFFVPDCDHHFTEDLEAEKYCVHWEKSREIKADFAEFVGDVITAFDHYSEKEPLKSYIDGWDAFPEAELEQLKHLTVYF